MTLVDLSRAPSAGELVVSGLALLDPDPVACDLTLAALRAGNLAPLVLHDPREALTLARDGSLDLIVAEMRLPVLDGLILLELLREQAPTVQVIFVAAQATRHEVLQALRRGRAFDFFLKPLVQPQELILSIHQALQRKAALELGRPQKAQGNPGLSPRELAVAEWLVAGVPPQEIARQLGLKEKSVRNTLSSLYQRLGVNGRTEAVLRCLSLGVSAKRLPTVKP
ncbi:MAG: response regulator transcription factor [Candidatus Sericytochromatia bacterium]|nr:response regulator transcription factor [Candidatus Sericytochromatia bacterium]